MLRYIDGPEVRFTQTDGIFLDAEFYHTKEKMTGLEPRRLFPKSGGNKYVTLLDGEGNDVAIIRDTANLLPGSKEAVENALEEYYMIPKITKFISMVDTFQIWMWTAETDHGVLTFEVKGHISTVKPLYDGRVMITDTSDNRYEIPDYRKMDKRSVKMIETML
ncbi:MAG: DUF1854 domain-containing protein [Clostridia bacterium]|nr:DUF1854 domain-containing protein [Clostridia bacterium]